MMSERKIKLLKKFWGNRDVNGDSRVNKAVLSSKRGKKA